MQETKMVCMLYEIPEATNNQLLVRNVCNFHLIPNGLLKDSKFDKTYVFLSKHLDLNDKKVSDIIFLKTSKSVNISVEILSSNLSHI
jgi:hypothetical protein